MNTTKVYQDLIGKSYNDIVNRLEIRETEGDCCGWSSCEISNRPKKADLDTLILKGCVLIDYSNENMSRQVLNFVFLDEDKEVVLGYDLAAGSGSGWAYGASVTLLLDGEELAEASW